MTSFEEYMMDFYGPNGIYSYEFSLDEIQQATAEYRATHADFEGDSIDREHVRDLVFALRELSML